MGPRRLDPPYRNTDQIPSSQVRGNHADPQISPTFVICVANDGCDDLSTGMVYRGLPDETAASEGYLRVVDDSGQDISIRPAASSWSRRTQEEEQKLLSIPPANFP